MRKEKIRLDELIVKKGLVSNLNHARSHILSGSITVDGRKITKIGISVDQDVQIQFSPQISDDVSRGAGKLRGALDFFFPENKEVFSESLVCDLGASTGGFTQVALEYGAKQVLSIDVGYGQLAGRLRNDPRVIVLDRYHSKDLDWKMIPQLLNNEIWFIADMSFISILSILNMWKSLKTQKPNILQKTIYLIKPQFEIDPRFLDKGIVRDPLKRISILWKLARIIKKEMQIKSFKICRSPIVGQKGNIEYFFYWEY